ncbi:Crp/Fnr family transcriptional regulator [Flavobacterium sp. ANB]|uniref:Crp/Fnr family transcriptional regulator n=1 Tax=unclassified Flavobacterium TaxID=196869 RepID=UPI0012B8D8A2|nr:MULTISPECIES: Crp/Fnr family transcriptional regulator [unclassified Flavobacterium]MBF4516915.1 Crp/Fnr family transcriptional regulator [Flavobacterium sp. ANB]MTD69189.1 cyclic nucleotide-binding domain-containing protein [Flavobacterium sp. LC2016-13]
MFEVFEKYIREKVVISDEDIALVRASSTIKKLRKGQSILHEGEVWAITCFIASGCFRLYRYDKEGFDHTARFGIENWWISDQESYNNQKPSEYNIEALAASTVIVWTKVAWEELMNTIPAMRLFNEQLLARGYESSQRRIFSLISHSAQEKYLDFQNTYPNVFNSVPLHMVASYLGISRETLSRIRREFINR